MGADHLRRQLQELRAQLEALQPARSAADYLAEYFAAPQYDGHRAAIIAALCGDEPRYRFRQQEEGDPPDHPSSYQITWPDRSRPPLVIRIRHVRNWRDRPTRERGDSLEWQDSAPSPDAPPEPAPEPLNDFLKRFSGVRWCLDRRRSWTRPHER
jgi:hypothetical protein